MCCFKDFLLAVFFVVIGPVVGLSLPAALMLCIIMHATYKVVLLLLKSMVLVGQQSGVCMDPQLSLANFVKVRILARKHVLYI